MSIWELLLLSLALSMDAFAVSISNSMCYAGITGKQTFTASLSFGVFQAVMPTVGFFAGRAFAGLISGIDHWLALVLLGFIGGKMLYEGIKALRQPGSCDTNTGAYGPQALLVQSVATSIDALAVGVSFAALEVQILPAALTIGAITFAVCLVGARLGRRFGLLLGDWAQTAGGSILVGIGVKIFIEHMFFGG